jgi:hypothetical protein
MSEEQQTMTQSYYVDSRRPRYRLYALLLVIGVIVVTAFVFTTTESSIDTIAKKYPDRPQLSNDNDAENVAYAMQMLFSETGLILNDVSGTLP